MTRERSKFGPINPKSFARFVADAKPKAPPRRSPMKEDRMYEWLLKDRDGEERNRRRDERDTWAWTLMGVVAFGTIVVVWFPILFAAYHA
jgi:hypothetical protein